MKLYTIDQVRRLYQIAHLGGYGKYIMDFEKDVKHITPIELPSDEEIEQDMIHQSGEYACGWEDAFRWMKEQILNQNK